jgi:SAM-dependent methyltransferase
MDSAVPNLGEYYPKDKYYSFAYESSVADDLISKISFFHTPIIHKVLTYFFLTDLNLDAIGKTRLSKTAKILDVGSGSGSTLSKLKQLGYEDIIGIDPYIEREIKEPIRILKENLEDFQSNRKFDLIMFLHSLEHVANPLRTLTFARNLLDVEGVVLIRTPVVSYAFEEYGEFWFQIDAPRHQFVYSEKGLEIITDRAGLQIVNSYYDSTDAQFIFSEAYKNNVAYNEWQSRRTSVSSLKENFFSSNLQRARRLNSQRRGDQAVVYAKKK